MDGTTRAGGRWAGLRPYVERGPVASGERLVELPWFVAVVGPGEEVLQRRSFRERVAFNRGETRTAFEADAVRLSLPVGEERRAADYRVLVSFELTPEEVAVNRRRGPR